MDHKNPNQPNQNMVDDMTDDEWDEYMEKQLEVAMTPIPEEELHKLHKLYGELSIETRLKRFNI